MSALKSSAQDAELLRWMAKQDRLRIERWYHSGQGELVSVWTALDDEDTPSGRAPTTLQALLMAKRAQEADR